MRAACRMHCSLYQYLANKGYCEDLTEGKFSFPVVHGVRANHSNRQILSGCDDFIALG